MKGHIKERSPGHWAIVLSLTDPATGKRKLKWHSFKGNKRAAQAECARLITVTRDGSYVEPSELARNPADAVDPPKIEWKPVQTYDMPQTANIIEHFRGRTLFVPILLAALCGLRRGEICALRWKNIDLVSGQLSVVESLEQTRTGLRFKSPKSGKGRTVALPPTVVAELRTYRAKRAQEMLRLGAGLSDGDLVIAHEDGSQITPIYISQQWGRLIAKTPPRPPPVS